MKTAFLHLIFMVFHAIKNVRLKSFCKKRAKSTFFNGQGIKYVFKSDCTLYNVHYTARTNKLQSPCLKLL